MERITYWWVMCGLPWARWALPAQDSLIQYPMLTWLHQATKSWDPSTTLVRWQSSVVEIKEKGVLRCFHSIAIGRYNVPVFVLQKGDTLSHQFWFGTLAVISWWMNVHSPFWPLSQPPLEKHPKKKKKKVSMPRHLECRRLVYLFAIHNVLKNTAREQNGFLSDQSDLRPQPPQIEFSDIHPINK